MPHPPSSARTSTASPPTIELRATDFEALSTGIGLGEPRRRTPPTPTLIRPHELSSPPAPLSPTAPPSAPAPTAATHHPSPPPPAPSRSSLRRTPRNFILPLGTTLIRGLPHLKNSLLSLLRRKEVNDPPETSPLLISPDFSSPPPFSKDLWQSPPLQDHPTSQPQANHSIAERIGRHIIDYLASAVIFSAMLVGILIAEGTLSWQEIATSLTQIGWPYILLFSYAFLLISYPVTWLIGVPRASQLLWRRKHIDR